MPKGWTDKYKIDTNYLWPCPLRGGVPFLNAGTLNAGDVLDQQNVVEVMYSCHDRPCSSTLTFLVHFSSPCEEAGSGLFEDKRPVERENL